MLHRLAVLTLTYHPREYTNIQSPFLISGGNGIRTRASRSLIIGHEDSIRTLVYRSCLEPLSHTTTRNTTTKAPKCQENVST